MAYGAFSTGSGASTYDLDMQAAEIINGNIKAPLTTTNNLGIATQSGEQIFAYVVREKQIRDDTALTSAVAGIVRMAEQYQAQNSDVIQSLITGMIFGQLIVPLTNSEGEDIATQNDINIAAIIKIGGGIRNDKN